MRKLRYIIERIWSWILPKREKRKQSTAYHYIRNRKTHWNHIGFSCFLVLFCFSAYSAVIDWSVTGLKFNNEPVNMGLAWLIVNGDPQTTQSQIIAGTFNTTGGSSLLNGTASGSYKGLSKGTYPVYMVSISDNKYVISEVKNIKAGQVVTFSGNYTWITIPEIDTTWLILLGAVVYILFVRGEIK